uniref:Putative secreted peptide n=1 Tax=Anopheles braziliensis TaxID=58242 RepID=A0A2M3ZRH1_9DIPT
MVGIIATELSSRRPPTVWRLWCCCCCCCSCCLTTPIPGIETVSDGIRDAGQSSRSRSPSCGCCIMAHDTHTHLLHLSRSLNSDRTFWGTEMRFGAARSFQ